MIRWFYAYFTGHFELSVADYRFLIRDLTSETYCIDEKISVHCSNLVVESTEWWWSCNTLDYYALDQFKRSRSTVYSYVCYVAFTKEPKKAFIQHTLEKHIDKKHEQGWGIWNLLCFSSTSAKGDDDQVSVHSSFHISGTNSQIYTVSNSFYLLCNLCHYIERKEGN